jgi:UPF0042 nucleotide-binding protein
MELLIVTGLSGAGKHAVLSALEDLGCTALDNVPIRLLRPLLESEAQQNPGQRLALGMDSRQEGFAEAFEPLLMELRAAGVKVHVLYVDADDLVLIRRFSESRRPHPLAQGLGFEEAIGLERRLMAPVRAHATTILNTSDLTLSQLRQRVSELLPTLGERIITLRILSFGFKYGLPAEADVVLDARFLPNPHYVPELKPLTGRDEAVQVFLLRSEPFNAFLNRAESWLRWSLPLIQAEGRPVHTFAIGCTGGQHRSVALAELLSKRLRKLPILRIIEHRQLAAAKAR